MAPISYINSYGWADWSFDNLNVNYEDLTVTLSYGPCNYFNPDGSINNNCSDAYMIIHCNNYIGFSFIGHWDENIIESIRIESEGDLITNSLKEINQFNGDPPIPLLGGGTKKIDSTWHQLLRL